MLEKINEYYSKKIPFVFIIDFLKERTVVVPVNNCAGQNIFFNINGTTNDPETIPDQASSSSLIFHYHHIDYLLYKEKFEHVKTEILKGNTYLLNLTFETPVNSNYSLRKLYNCSEAKYKLFFKDEFIVFSPETFITINHDKIKTRPMKGTIDASVKNAEELLLNDSKESAELATITDLLRNDLSKVASNVEVIEFKHIDRIVTNRKTLLQQSALIEGKIQPEYFQKPGDIFEMILPAGSISGAPKEKTLEIIKKTENHSRGFYTGVFGYADGEKLESGVMIRYIEKRKNKKYYKSGGGITFMSDPEKEYNELMDKIYVPIY